MRKESIDRKSSRMFNDFQLELAENQTRLQPFLEQTFHLDNVLKQIVLKSSSFDAEKRTVLVDALKDSYSGVVLSEPTKQNIDKLLEKESFTVTTGHQLSIFTGPLFFVYKILHVIKLAERWKREFPQYDFIPTFWMASEDHDFAEINSIELFGKSFSWETEQNGAVGRFFTDGLDVIIEEFEQKFEGKEDVLKLLQTYKGKKTLADATMHIVNSLFGKYGLVIVQGDHPKLKKAFVPIMQKELEENFSFHSVQKTNEELEKEGIHPQAHVREVNLFKLSDKGRHRLMKEENGDLKTEIEAGATREDWSNRIMQHPEDFSPNVFLRPLYQETILPNLCYVGGVGELAYWLQLKAAFQAVSLPFPMLSARTSAIWFDTITQKKLAKSGFHWKDVMDDLGVLKARHVQRSNGDEVDFSKMDSHFQEFCTAIEEKFKSTDPGLHKYVLAEKTRMQQMVNSMKERLIKSLKQQHEDVFKALDTVYARVYPNNGFQERSLNLFSLAGNGDIHQKIEFMYQEIDPMDTSIHVFFE